MTSTNEQEAFRQGYKEGRKFSDWISIKNELPPYNRPHLLWDGLCTMTGSLLVRANKETYWSLTVFEGICKAESVNTRSVAYPFEKVTHWMAIQFPEDFKNG